MKFSGELDFVMMHLVTKQDNIYGFAFKSYDINSLFQFATKCNMEAELIVKVKLEYLHGSKMKQKILYTEPTGNCGLSASSIIFPIMRSMLSACIMLTSAQMRYDLNFNYKY